MPLSKNPKANLKGGGGEGGGESGDSGSPSPRRFINTGLNPQFVQRQDCSSLLNSYLKCLKFTYFVILISWLI